MSDSSIAALDSVDSLAGTHPLDSPIWNALTTRQHALAEGDEFARRYPHDIAPFGAILDASPSSLDSLGRILPPGTQLPMFAPSAFTPPSDAFTVTRTARIDQMILMTKAEPSAERSETFNPVPLTPEDVPEMLELVSLTKPGPFGPRTIELGSYLGVRVDGQLVAMVGERFKLDGYTEVSAVCTHPDFRGRGYSRDLVTWLAAMIQERGEVPFLHVFADNPAAISLYRKLGFRLRRAMHLTVIGRANNDNGR